MNIVNILCYNKTGTATEYDKTENYKHGIKITHYQCTKINSLSMHHD